MIAAAGQMFLWNPFPDLIQGVAARVIGWSVIRIAIVVWTSVYYVRQYQRELREFYGVVADEMKATVSDIPYRQERNMAVRMAAPDLLSLSRPALGFAAAVLLWQGLSVQALGVYAFGIVTDVVDGWLARRLRGGTTWGKDLDGITDSVMNLSVFAAVIAVGITKPNPLYLATAAFLVVLWILTRLFTAKHSVVAKYRSGVTRSVLYLAIAVSLPFPWQWAGLAAGAVLLIVGGGYEFGVARRDRSTGARPLIGDGWLKTYLGKDGSSP